MSDIVPLVRVENGNYAVEETTLEWIRGLGGPLSVVMVAGKFRQGKSFLLNRFVGCEPGKGFGVGGTVQACTRGIWVHRHPLRGADGRPVLVMDTEGIDALDVDSSHDMRIFALAVLLGSVFCYNSMSHIDEAAVQTLSLMTRVAGSLSSSSHNPSLYWVLRDFSLILVDEEDNPMTHEQYLEKALTSPLAAKCATREAIKNVFTKRHLVTLPRPHKTETSRLDKLDKKGGEGTKGVSVKFMKYLDVFREHVLKNAPVMTAAGVAMTGQVYADHVHNIVTLVNDSDSVPPLDDAWSLLTRAQHADTLQRLRDDSIKEAQACCPTTTEDGVRAYLQGLTERCFSDACFMAPAPDAEKTTRSIVEHLFDLMKAMNKCVDVDGLASEEVSKVYLGFKDLAPEDWDILSLLSTELEWDNKYRSEGHIASKLLISVCKDLWPIARDRLLKFHNDASDALAKVNALEQALDQATGREARLTEELDAVVKRPKEDVGTMTEEVECVTDSCVDAPEEGNVTALQARLCEMETSLSEVRYSNERKDHDVERIKQQCEAYERGMETLRDDARVTLERFEREKREAQEVAAVATKKADLAESQSKALKEEIDALQSLVREGQTKTVDMHRLTLEETRRRDQEARENSERTRKAHSEMYARAEVAERETRSLKRRVEELLETDEEAKRLRGNLHKQEIGTTRLQANVDTLRSQMDHARTECDALRASNVELQNKIAVLEAAQKLDFYRREIVR